MTQEELDLIQFASCHVAKSCASPPQVVRGKLLDFRPPGGVLYDMPDCLGRDARSPHTPESVDSTKDKAVFDVCGLNPLIDCAFCPRRDGNSADVFAFADQVCHDPMVFANLKVLFLQTD
jgi:hypothetical protein